MEDEKASPAAGDQPTPLAHLEIDFSTEKGQGEGSPASEAQPTAVPNSGLVGRPTSDTPVKITDGGDLTPRARIKIIFRKVGDTVPDSETDTL
jgi:hypothetical protein